MRKIVYKALCKVLLSIDGIEHVDIWNNQILHIEEEQAFLTPAVFVEFGEIDWHPLSHGCKEAICPLDLHIVTDSRVSPWSNAIEVFDLIDKVNRAIHGFAVNEDTEAANTVADAFTNIKSITDSDFDELADNVERYEFHVTDGSGYKR